MFMNVNEENTQINQLAKRYIDREIFQSASSLVEDMISLSCTVPTINEAGFNLENIRNLYMNKAEISEYFGVSDDDEIENIIDNNEHQKEIYEWWQVSEWLYRELENLGEPVLDTSYGFFWGRTCTGQAIILDGTLQKIANKYI